MGSLFRRIVNAIKGEDAAQSRPSSCANPFGIVAGAIGDAPTGESCKVSAGTNGKVPTGTNGEAPTGASRELSGGFPLTIEDFKASLNDVKPARLAIPSVRKGCKSSAERREEMRREIEAAAPFGMVWDGDWRWSEEKKGYVPLYVTPEEVRARKKRREELEALEKEVADFYDFRGAWRP